MSNSLPKDEKYTPAKYIKSVKKVFGGTIDLDPASCEIANSRIKAIKYYDRFTNGLKFHWEGNTFLNPPYSRGNLLPFTEHLINDYEVWESISQAIYLVPNWTERKWFQPLWNYTICFTDHRIPYLTYNPHNKKFEIEDNPEGGSCFVYFGSNATEFMIEFEQYGHIVQPSSYV